MSIQASPMARALIPIMQKARRERAAHIAKCPICRGLAQSECCAVLENVIVTSDLNRDQRAAKAKAARILAPKLTVIEFLFGVKKV